MDRQLLKAYIRTIVEEEVQRILPEMLSEAVSQVKRLSENTTRQPVAQKSTFDRKKLAQLIGYDGETIKLLMQLQKIILR
jgi:dephospho-CoA kinase